MIFTVKVACNKEIVKVANLAKKFGGNRRSGCTHVWSRKRLTTSLLLPQNTYS